MTYALTMFLPIEHRDAGNRVSEAKGWGPNNYTIERASPDAPEIATWVGLYVEADQSTLDLLNAVRSGYVPEGIDPTDLSNVMANLRMRYTSLDQAGTQAEEIAALCAEIGVVPVVREEDVSNRP